YTNAEKSYREAIRRAPRLANSYLGLAKIYQKQGKFSAALVEADVAVKIDPERTGAHYIRGQLFLRLGRGEKTQKEEGLAAGEGERKKPASLPSPELMQDAQ